MEVKILGDGRMLSKGWLGWHMSWGRTWRLEALHVVVVRQNHIDLSTGLFQELSAEKRLKERLSHCNVSFGHAQNGSLPRACLSTMDRSVFYHR